MLSCKLILSKWLSQAHNVNPYKLVRKQLNMAQKPKRLKEFDELSDEDKAKFLEAEKAKKELDAIQKSLITKPKQTPEERKYSQRRSMARNFSAIAHVEDCDELIARFESRKAELLNQ